MEKSSKITRSSYENLAKNQIRSTKCQDSSEQQKASPKRFLNTCLNEANKQNINEQQKYQYGSPQGLKKVKINVEKLSHFKLISPERRQYIPKDFRSNKAQQCLVQDQRSPKAVNSPRSFKQCNQLNQNKQKIVEHQKLNDSIIFSGLSRDGKFRVVSKAFQGQELKKARIYQLKQQLKTKNQLISSKNRTLPQMDSAKSSNQSSQLIEFYSVNTHEGISRNYNQDRVSIILNINKNGIKGSFFAVYDGHGGTGCCDFLRDYLHQYIINHESFTSNPKKALIQGIHKTQKKFIDLVQKKYAKTKQLDRSGSCAVIVLILNNQCYVANVGDSRVFLSKNNGKVISHLSRDHKPSDQKQQQRIIKNGGKIYRTQMTRVDKLKVKDKIQLKQNQDYIIGPLRVFPGKLSVTRTFGDIEAKQKQFGGLSNCVKVQPQIARFTITQNDDFLFLGCDGIFERMQSVEVNKLIWKKINEYGDNTIKNQENQINIHKLSGLCVDQILKQSMRRRSADNLTAIMVGLKNLLKINNQRTLNKNASCRSI